MPRPPQTAELATLRAQRVQADAALARLIAEVEQARRHRDRLISQGASAASIGTASLDYTQARKAYDTARTQRGNLLQAVTALSAAAAQAGEDAQSADLFSHLEGDTPVLLFPVRLETRYERDAQGLASLLVRIYPDAAQVQRHLQALTEVEQAAGRAYWAARFARLGQPRTEKPSEAQRMLDQRPEALWAEMVKALRAPRAAYVVNRTRPLNAFVLDLAEGVEAHEPDFPPLDAPGSRLAAQPTAVMLPDRFCVIGLDAAGRVLFRRFGAPVPDVLPMAPAIEPGDAPPLDQTPRAFDGEAAWLGRFDKAVAQGMGIRVRQADVDAYRQAHPGTPAFSLNQPIERLVVLGIDWTLTPDQAAAGVTALFEAQAASAGIGFLPIGTPTNNTAAASSGHSPAQLRDPARATPTPPSPGTSAVEALRFALGLPDDSFDHVAIAQGELDDAALSGHMLNALYAGTLGAYLREAWDSDRGSLRLSEDTHDAIRAHVVTHLRPTGPLQPLRIDTQPYGLLPVVAPQRYQGADAFENGLTRVLGALRPKWEQVVSQVPRFDGDTARTHALLRQGPWAQSAAYRLVEKDATISPALTELATFQQGLRELPDGLFMQTLSATWGASSARAEVLSALPLSRFVIHPDTNILPQAMPWVLADSQLPNREADGASPAPAYLTQLTEAIDRHADLKQAFAGLRQASALLQGLLAWSADREADVGNAHLLSQVNQSIMAGSTTQLLKTPLTLGVAPREDQVTAFQVEHVGQIAGLRLQGVTGDEPIGQHVARAASVAVQQAQAEGSKLAYAPWHQSHRTAELERWRTRLPRPVRHLASVRASLGELSERTVGELNWALRSALDAFDHRLDAWYTSLATRRLATLRAGQDGQRQQGLHVGAYGWVEHLQPDPVGERESQGHMLMPSLRHGAAAAVLRSGYLNSDATERPTFSLDLASRRVRAARDLLEGLTLGQPIAVQLGYRFERGLRDAGLAAYISGLRRALPLRAPAGGGSEPSPEAEARDVVDGARLLALSADAAAHLLTPLPAPAPAPTAADRARVVALHAELVGLWDALADVAVTEGVYQVTQGNMERAAAALSFLDKQTQPVEPQSVLSPREGVSYTQRVALLFDTQAPAPAGWTADELTQAEPTVNAWLAELIGEPSRFVMRAQAWVAGEEAPRAVRLHAAEIGASPLALALAVNAPGTGSTQAQLGKEPSAPGDTVQDLSRLRVLVVEAFQTQLAQQGVTPARLQIEEQRPGEHGLLHLEALLALGQRLVLQSRAATRRDLAVTEPRFDTGNTDGDHAGVQAEELLQRAQGAQATLNARAQGLQAALLAKDLASIAKALRSLRHFGVLGAEAPASLPADPAAALAFELNRAQTALADVQGRLTKVNEQLATAGSTVASRAQTGIDTLKTLFGKGFPVIPLFTPAETAASIQASLQAQPTLTAKRPAAVASWLPKMAKVRDGVERLQSLLLAREALVAPYASTRFAVLQSTARPGQTAPWEQAWMALPEAWPPHPEEALLGTSHQRPDLAVALLGPDILQQVKPDTLLAGLVIDDWAETVPLHTSTAAIAFHFDAPGARPPQTLLLAVPPRMNMAHWDFDTLLDTVNEAAALSRLRGVRPTQLPDAVNLALPMNLIPDSTRPDAAGFQLKALSDKALLSEVTHQTVASLALGKV